ncbi:cytochrome bd ubiquinol oxidase subunit I [Thermincola ferriacetica]|uniref:Cytochrome bd ubiquinol oxidase subunit I n=1 Tax=Thermincola ferriacetica TaxID=281456 RepID=A0A0L6W1X9_9FIRM|nr:cytochrome ubiquinol oxidase subunit I [Thermincola ferriacetica]KNZ69084.1 cytochrome bd ubiquinol oxidase subunit I [Thermincola ferriacetica]
MDAVFLSRLQFGLTAFFHFLFPPLSIGLATIIAVMEFLYWRTGKEVYDRMSRFWFKLFAIIFAVGVASGITMEFQFGTNWSEYSRFVGDIFGAPLAAEGVFAFFLESTFMGLLLFGRDRISKAMRFFASFFVALGSTLSAFWIIVANSWQQTPAGFQIEGGRAVLTDFFAAVFNPSTIPRYLHTVDASYITAAFFVIGISAWFLLRNKNVEVAKGSMKIALIFALFAVVAQGFLGDMHAKQVAVTQPAKLAAFEGMWENSANASLNLIGFPDPQKEETRFSIGVPGLLSWLVYGDTRAEITGLKAFTPEDRPPVLATYWSYRVMIFLFGWFVLLVLWGAYLFIKGRIYTDRRFLKTAYYSMLLPLAANEFGWFAAEIGRQPWIVNGLLKTGVAVSPLPAGEILLTILLFVVVYSGLLGALVYLIRREVKKAAVEEDMTATSAVSLSGTVPVQQ